LLLRFPSMRSCRPPLLHRPRPFPRPWMCHQCRCRPPPSCHRQRLLRLRPAIRRMSLRRRQSCLRLPKYLPCRRSRPTRSGRCRKHHPSSYPLFRPRRYRRRSSKSRPKCRRLRSRQIQLVAFSKCSPNASISCHFVPCGLGATTPRVIASEKRECCKAGEHASKGSDTRVLHETNPPRLAARIESTTSRLLHLFMISSPLNG